MVTVTSGMSNLLVISYCTVYLQRPDMVWLPSQPYLSFTVTIETPRDPFVPFTSLLAFCKQNLVTVPLKLVCCSLWSSVTLLHSQFSILVFPAHFYNWLLDKYYIIKELLSKLNFWGRVRVLFIHCTCSSAHCTLVNTCTVTHYLCLQCTVVEPVTHIFTSAVFHKGMHQTFCCYMNMTHFCL